jgi:hypothetical protein
MLKKILFFLILLLLNVSYFKAKKVPLKRIELENNQEFFYNLSPNKNHHFVFQNPNEEDVNFWFRQKGGVNLKSSYTIVNSIISDSMSDEDKAIALWHFVAKSGFHYYFEYNNKLNDNIKPESLLTFPYYMCGEKAGVLANLSKFIGLDARVVNLHNHIVAEIFYNNAWHMYDANENVIFIGEDGLVEGVFDIANNMKIINKENAVTIDKENFKRISEYRNYFGDIKKIKINNSDNFIVKNYNPQDFSIVLKKEEKIHYILNKSSNSKRAMYSNYLFETMGVIESKVKINDLNNSYLFKKNFPYYIKSIQIESVTNIIAKPIILVNDRNINKIRKIELKNFKSNMKKAVFFNAPDKDLYYDYELVFENLAKNKEEEVIIKTYFDFNALTFPFYKNQQKVIFEISEKENLKLNLEIFN